LDAWGGAQGLRAAAIVAAAVLVAGCGGGDRQDENEPEGNFKVDVVEASFPNDQKLAKRSTMKITVKNVDRRTIPDIVVTVKSFDRKKDDPTLADPSRPVFVVNRGPEGGETASVDTYGLGPLKPGEQKTFSWNVTAVQAGPYKISWEMAAGLNGKAKAVPGEGSAPTRGVFRGTIDEKPPQTKVAEDGKTVVPAD
jgi:hypothetical protein